RASHFLPMVDENGVREEPKGRVESVIEDIATEAEAKALDLRAGSKVIRILRVRSLGGKPAVVDRICLPARRFASMLSRPPEDLSGLLYGLYEKDYGMTVVEAIE